MIDPGKCEFEESYKDPDLGETTYYFTYPKDFSFAGYDPEEDYGNVISMCVSLTVADNGEYYMAMSPTVEIGDSISDVDWRDLYDGCHYDDSVVSALLAKIQKD